MIFPRPQLLAPALLTGLALLPACATTDASETGLQGEPVDAAALVGDWTVERLQDGTVDGEAAPHFRFAEDGRFEGSTGVNGLHGRWSLGPAGLELSGLATTLMAGSPERMELERRFLDALEVVRGAARDEAGSLRLEDAEGRLLVEASPRPRILRGLLSGAVTYRERIALTPGHQLEVQLLDVSRADAQAEVCGSYRAEVRGQVPLDFSVGYVPSSVQEGRSYVLRATLRDAEGELKWTTTEAFPVFTPDSPYEGIGLILRRVP